jgi:hypothetical protein
VNNRDGRERDLIERVVILNVNAKEKKVKREKEKYYLY